MANPLTFMLPLDPSKNLAELLTKIAANQAALNGALASVGTVHYADLSCLTGRKKICVPPSVPRADWQRPVRLRRHHRIRRRFRDLHQAVHR